MKELDQNNKIITESNNDARTLIAFSTHDLNMLNNNLKYWESQLKKLLPATSPEKLKKDSLEFISASTIYAGWIPLQIWRDTINYLLEGESKHLNAYDYDFPKILEWLYATKKDMTGGYPKEFNVKGIEKMDHSPQQLKPLAQIILLDLTNYALNNAKNKAEINLELNKQDVQIIFRCQTDIPSGLIQSLKEYQQDIQSIQKGEGVPFKKLLPGYGNFPRLVAILQKKLGAEAWDLNLKINENKNQRSDVMITLIIK